ncbi:MAG: hypothetical protein WDZ52_00105 [Pseudohongiellaceae bacterium]
MPNSNESQCYFIQLQIDGYLDQELNEAQQLVFVSHVQACAVCASEFRYAQTVHDAVMELPQIDCMDSVLEPVYRSAAAESQTAEPRQRESLPSQLGAFLYGLPLYFRYGLSSAVVAVIALAVSFSVITPRDKPEQLVANESAEQYSAEDISRALEELNVAIDYLNQLSQRTEVMIGDRFLVSPIQDSINASFEKAMMRESDPLQNGPI